MRDVKNIIIISLIILAMCHKDYFTYAQKRTIIEEEIKISITLILTYYSGDFQYVEKVGDKLPQPVKVRVINLAGQGVNGVTINFRMIEPDAAMRDLGDVVTTTIYGIDGIAHIQPTLNKEGFHTIIASAEDVEIKYGSPVYFTVYTCSDPYDLDGDGYRCDDCLPNNSHYGKQCCTPTTTWKTRVHSPANPCYTIVKGEAADGFGEGCYIDSDCNGRPDGCTAEYEWVQQNLICYLPTPTVSITTPSEGASFIRGEKIEIKATATNADYVEFRVNNSLKGRDYAAPYEATWQTTEDTSAGYYKIRAVAYRGRKTASSIIGIYIIIPTIAITVTLPNDNISFTTLDAENDIRCTADIKPDTLDATYNSKIKWRVTDNPNDAINSGDPADPADGATVTFAITAPAAPNGRGAPLSYNIRTSVTIHGIEVSETATITQDERDQCRQEYIDMNKTRTPTRGEFVNEATYVNPGNFPFSDINSTRNPRYNWVIFTIAQRLQNIRSAIGNQEMPVTSGYRNPRRNAEIGGAPESRHIYGDAADIGLRDWNGDGRTDKKDWELMRRAAKNEGACVKPYEAGATYIHMDWRPEGCPAGW